MKAKPTAEPIPAVPAESSISYKHLALLAAVALLITLPFIDKAFHHDDAVFIWLAQERLADPLAPGLTDHGFRGDLYPEYYDTHPPLVAGYLAVLIKLFGSATETGLHLGFIVFPLVGAFSMYALARRFTDSPLAAALIIIVSPGVMVMSQSVMSDMPTLAFWLAAIAAYIYGVDRGSGRLLAVAGAFIVLAVMTTYQSLSLLPLLLLYILLRRRVTWTNLAPLAAGLAAFGLFVVYFFLATGGPPKLSYGIGIITESAFISRKVLSIVSVLGGAIVAPVILAVGMLKGKRDYLAFGALVALLSVSIAIQVAAGEYTLLPAILQVTFYAAGILAFYRFVKVASDAAFAEERSGSELDSIFLFVWIGGVLVYSIALLPYASTRYLLPLFPPVVLMFVRYARGVISGERNWRWFAAAAVVLTAIPGFAVAVADYQLSGVFRDFSADFAQDARDEGRRVWVAGEFGLRYYLEEEGASYITYEGEQPSPGDYVIISHQLISSFIGDELERQLELERVVDYPVGWPVRVQDEGSLAGFYSQFHGYLPYSLSSQPIESIGIYVVAE